MADVEKEAELADRLCVGMTLDGSFRVITVKATDTVRQVFAKQDADPTLVSTRLLGELVAAAALVRQTMAPTYRVQGVLRGAGGNGQIVADSHPEGWCRGLAHGKGTAALGEGANLMMMRTMLTGRLQRGVVEAPLSGGLSGALMNYMQQSEQIVSTIGVACVVEGGEVQHAGGFVVQLLPEAPDNESTMAVMTERMALDFNDMGVVLEKFDGNPKVILDEILYGMPYEHLHTEPIRYDCNCSHVRIMAGLATLPRVEIEEFISDGEDLEIDCDYCREKYIVKTEHLRGLLDAS